MNYLGDPTLTLVKELKNMDEIWDQLFKSFGDGGVLLQNKLGDLLVGSIKLKVARTSCMAFPL